MTTIRFFLHDDEKATGLTTKRALDAFYDYVLDDDKNIISKVIDGKEYRAMSIDMVFKQDDPLAKRVTQ